jgi:glycosyltransferase involved in cell wall biosynthesis
VQIIFGIERYWPASGGAEAYVRSIAQTLAMRHHIVTVVTLVRDDDPLTPIRRSLRLQNVPEAWDGPVRIVSLHISNWDRILLSPILLQMLPIKSRRIYERLRTLGFELFARVLCTNFLNIVKNADVIHTIAPWEMSHLANLAKKKLGIPHIMTGLMHPGFWADDFHSFALYKQSNYLIALLNSEKEEYLKIGIPPIKIKVIGTPSPVIHCPNKLLFQSAFPTENPIILFLGVKRWYKGYDLLLQAAPFVWKKIPQTTFVFIGPRSKESIALFSHISDPRIIETDRISDELRNSALDACNVLCLPSATEIMPNVILEAWTAGKPVVVSNIPTLVELVTGGGLCVQRKPEFIADALIQILSNPALAKQLSTEGKRRANGEFSVGQITSALEETYYEIINKAFISKD